MYIKYSCYSLVFFRSFLFGFYDKRCELRYISTGYSLPVLQPLHMKAIFKLLKFSKCACSKILLVILVVIFAFAICILHLNAFPLPLPNIYTS